MEIKNFFDPAVKQEIIDRVNNLTPQTKNKWGKMTVSQMLAHVQLPIKCAYGTHEIKGNFVLRLVGPLFKSVLYNERPYKQGLPTDPTYVIIDEKHFDTEKSALLELINKFSPENIITEKHPVFGKMTNDNWSKATWKHLDHHLRQFGV